jgi:Na+-driven multidrug efflux pump
MNFLGIAVTNLYANAYANNDHDECYRVLRSGKSIGIMLGVVLLFVQLNLAQRFIGILAGPNLEIVPYAMKYAKIRALGALAAVPTIAIQAAFLASKDSVTPLVAVMVGAVVNLVGDLVLVNGFNMGIVGAAWATMLSQVMSYIYLLRSEHKLRKNVVTSVAVRVPIEAPTDNDVVRLGKDVDPVTGAVSIKMTVDKKSSSGSGSSEAIELGTGSSIGSGSSGSSASGSTGDWGIASSMTKSKMRLGGGSVQQQQEQNYGGEATSAEEALDVLESTVEAFPVPIQEATAQATTITATLIEDLPEVPAKVQREGRSSLLGPFYMPTRKEISEYFSFCGPVFCILLLKTSLWNSTTVAVAPSGAAALAAHQILINFFLYFVIFGDVLSQCSQTYLPALIKRTRKNMSNSFAPARKLVLTTLKLAAIVGVLNSLVGVGLVKFAVGSITPSKEIHEWTLTAATGFAMTILPHACLSSFEGVIMATRDIRFQSLIYFITSVSFVAYQVWVQKQSMGIKYVWYGFSAYQWVRLAFFAGRVKHRMGKVRMQSRDLSLREGPGAIDNQGQQQQQLAM